MLAFKGDDEDEYADLVDMREGRMGANSLDEWRKTTSEPRVEPGPNSPVLPVME
jgi:hypothetical protein